MIDRVAGRPRPPAGRGAGRASSGSCPGCSTARSPFGGEESAGRVVPAPRRLGVDHRQGRHPAGPARLGDPGAHRQEPQPALRRADRAARRPGLRPRSTPPATREEKAKLAALSPDDVTAPTRSPASRSPPSSPQAPGNGAAIGGLKVTTESAWFAARPCGTEDVYKIYAESFRGPDHLAAGAGRGQGGRLRRPRRLTAFPPPGRPAGYAMRGCRAADRVCGGGAPPLACLFDSHPAGCRREHRCGMLIPAAPSRPGQRHHHRARSSLTRATSPPAEPGPRPARGLRRPRRCSRSVRVHQFGAGVPPPRR